MANIFNNSASRKPRYSKFDLSHERKFSFNMGELVPCYVQDVLPGDNFRVRADFMLRVMPMLAPIMHRVNVDIHYFFVPNRLIWTEWQAFITGGREGISTPVPPFVTIDTDGKGVYTAPGFLSDYLGVPDCRKAAGAYNQPAKICTLAHRAYQLIWSDYYRDQNLSGAPAIPLSSGEETDADWTNILAVKRNRCWEKDYNTSALPWAQRGASVDIPIGQGDITYKEVSNVFAQDGSDPGAGNLLTAAGDGFLRVEGGPTFGRIENIDQVDFEAVTINELREAFRLQEWLEKNARGGARYIEQIWSHFGVRSSDARLQRPEYLGGGRSPISISEVLSTFQDPGGTGEPQGNMAGHGVSSGHAANFTRRFEEHGYVIGLMSVLPRTGYMQGMPRHFTRFDKLEYAWPEFANLGEQAVLNKEVMFNPEWVDNDETFGYQERYAEYKYMPSTVHGEMKSSLRYWHMARYFNPTDGRPVLNENFVTADPTTRIFAVEEDPGHLLVMLHNGVSAIRPLPYQGIPTI